MLTFVTQKFADRLAKSTTNFGSALLYYARAHKADKVKDLLDFLSSLCITHSVAYPPEPELDESLRAFTSSPGSSLNRLDRSDHEAAQILSRYMSGYATIRRFYNLRDEQHASSTGSGSYGSAKRNRRKGRTKEAADALIALIKSASDSIHGGLFDPDIDAVLQVDGLLALLGEALPFLNREYFLRHSNLIARPCSILSEEGYANRGNSYKKKTPASSKPRNSTTSSLR